MDQKCVRLYRRRDGTYPGRCEIDQRLIDTEYYWRNVCFQENEFRHAGKFPVEYLLGDNLSRLF